LKRFHAPYPAGFMPPAAIALAKLCSKDHFFAGGAAFLEVYANLSGVDLYRAFKERSLTKLAYAMITQLLSQSPKSDFTGSAVYYCGAEPAYIGNKSRL